MIQELYHKYKKKRGKEKLQKKKKTSRVISDFSCSLDPIIPRWCSFPDLPHYMCQESPLLLACKWKLNKN